MGRGLLLILVLLNGAHVTALVDTGAKILTVSPDVVQWARLLEVGWDCPILVMGEGTEVQSFCVFGTHVQYQR